MNIRADFRRGATIAPTQRVKSTSVILENAVAARSQYHDSMIRNRGAEK